MHRCQKHCLQQKYHTRYILSSSVSAKNCLLAPSFLPPLTDSQAVWSVLEVLLLLVSVRCPMMRAQLAPSDSLVMELDKAWVPLTRDLYQREHLCTHAVLTEEGLPYLPPQSPWLTPQRCKEAK